jgi:uncharacterized protein (TIGR00299 family) protein
MRIAFFDCIGGASGDMLLSALLDAGATEAQLNHVITALHLHDCSARVEQVMSGALSAKQVIIITPRKETERHATELISIIDQADLSESVKSRAIAILQRLAQVEAHIHNASIDTVHLHEIGGDDTVIDIVGVISALDELQVERVYVSPLPLARGMIQSMHGLLPLPAPATLALLKDVPVHYVNDVEAELVTPTGAALLTSLADEWGDFPPMQLKITGVGAGRRQLPFPNIVRVWIGETQADHSEWITETLVLLETNIDDINPQVYEHVMDKLFAAGALDVTLTSIQMKKNRPGEMLSVLCRPQDADRLQWIIFSETITLGVRHKTCERICLPRTIETVATQYGPIRVKVARWGGLTHVAPEYDDCRIAAEAHRAPLLQVMAAAQESYRVTAS